MSILGASQPVEQDERDQFPLHLPSSSQRYFTDTDTLKASPVQGNHGDDGDRTRAMPYKTRSHSQDDLLSPTRTRQPLRIRVTKDGAHVIGSGGKYVMLYLVYETSRLIVHTSDSVAQYTLYIQNHLVLVNV